MRDYLVTIVILATLAVAAYSYDRKLLFEATGSSDEHQAVGYRVGGAL